MYARLNILVPTETYKKLKKIAPKRGIGKYMTEAAEEKIRRAEIEKILKEMRAMPPAFPHIKNAAKWVHDMRRRDLKRMKRLGIIK